MRTGRPEAPGLLTVRAPLPARTLEGPAGDRRTLDHALELLVRDVEAPGPKAAVRVHPDLPRVPEVLGRPKDAVRHELRALHLVAVHVDDPEADLPVVAVLLEQLEDLVPVAIRPVAVGELP